MQGQAGGPAVFKLLLTELVIIYPRIHFAPLMSWNYFFDQCRYPGKFLSFPFHRLFSPGLARSALKES